MKLQYFCVCILAAASLTVSPEILLAHGRGGHGGGGGSHGFGGGDGGHAFVGGGGHGFGGGHAFGGFTGRGFNPGFRGTRGFSFVRGDHGHFGDRGFRGRDRDFRGRRFRTLMGTSPISASMGSDIQIITSTTTRLTTHTLLVTTVDIKG